MGGIIPEDEDEYDDCVSSSMPAPIDDDIYEELPGLPSIYFSYFIFSRWMSEYSRCLIINLVKMAKEIE